MKDLRSKYKNVIPPRCIISGHSVEGDLTLAHILPHSTEARIQQIVGMVKKLDNFRNLMWLCSGLEVAFDQKQLSLEPVDALTRTVFKVRVWEIDILEKPLYLGASENISSIVDRIIDFSSSFDKNTIPYRRCLSYHAMMCYLTALENHASNLLLSRKSAESRLAMGSLDCGEIIWTYIFRSPSGKIWKK